MVLMKCLLISSVNAYLSEIQSHHVSSRTHKLWIEYDEDMVKGWYCQSQSGTRVVGTWAHAPSDVWFLGVMVTGMFT